MLDLSPYVIIPRPEQFEEKKRKILEGTIDDLSIITDFDRTLTTNYYDLKDGKLEYGMTTYSLLGYGKLLSSSYKEMTQKVMDKYLPIEFDPKVPLPRKKEIMEEWWRTSNGILVNEKPSWSSLQDAVRSARIHLRDGVLSVFDLSNKYSFPIVIFSAGIDQIIREIIVYHSKLPFPKNVHIFSNKIIFDGNQNVAGFEEPLVHSLNKKDHSIQSLKNEKEAWVLRVKERKNVILAGDHFGDAFMSDGLGEDTNIIKFGFLNEKEEELLEDYKKVFDVIILNDGSFHMILNIINELLNKKKAKD